MSHCISIVCACCGPVGLFRVGCSADVLHYSDILMVVMCPTPIPQMNISHLRVWDSPLLETSIACILKASFKEYVHIYIYCMHHLGFLQGVCVHTYIYIYPSRSVHAHTHILLCTKTRLKPALGLLHQQPTNRLQQQQPCSSSSSSSRQQQPCSSSSSSSPKSSPSRRRGEKIHSWIIAR
jgi:hypothetical protein